ncbi:hypothetical protein ACFQX6_46205 [Streptosporangium lutulentum]
MPKTSRSSWPCSPTTPSPPPARAFGDEHRAAFEIIDADPNNELIVAELDGEVVGTMQLTYIPGISRRGALRMQIEAASPRPTRDTSSR